MIVQRGVEIRTDFTDQHVVKCVSVHALSIPADFPFARRALLNQRLPLRFALLHKAKMGRAGITP